MYQGLVRDPDEILREMGTDKERISPWKTACWILLAIFALVYKLYLE